MEKWRYLLEPLIANSHTPMPWDVALRQPSVLFEGKESVVVANRGAFEGKPALQVWLTAGVMDEVDQLLDQAEDYAREHGFASLTYVGRRGWCRARGFTEVAVVAVKEIC